MKLPTQAKDAHKALAAAYNSGDVNTVLKMYDTDGYFVDASRDPVSGKAQFEAVIRSILAIKGRMEIKTVYCIESGDTAVGRSEWSIVDGHEVKISARGIEVMKRQTDGTWKVLIDHAFGAE